MYLHTVTILYLAFWIWQAVSNSAAAKYKDAKFIIWHAGRNEKVPRENKSLQKFGEWQQIPSKIRRMTANPFKSSASASKSLHKFGEWQQIPSKIRWMTANPFKTSANASKSLQKIDEWQQIPSKISRVVRKWSRIWTEAPFRFYPRAKWWIWHSYIWQRHYLKPPAKFKTPNIKLWLYVSLYEIL